MRRELTRWASVEVYGRPWMAPRAGFEVERNALSAHVVMYVDQLNTPSRTPLPSSLEFTAFGEGVVRLPSAGRLTR